MAGPEDKDTNMAGPEDTPNDSDSANPPAASSKPDAPPKDPVQVQKHRASSAAWHAKWISKGVPKVPKVGTETKKVKKDKPVENPEITPVTSLQSARDQFITKWISKSDMPPSNERRKAAIAAWMSSDLRASIIAGREGTQK